MRLRPLGWAAVLVCALSLWDHAQAQPEAEQAVAAPVPVDSDAGTLLAMAEDAMTEIDYGRSRDLANAALARGKLDKAGLIRAYSLIAVSSAQLGDQTAAEQAFVRLFALDPDSRISTRLAPERRSAVLNARGFWSVHHDAFGLDVSYARRERQIEVRVRDALAWGAAVHVWFRFGDRTYEKRLQPAGRDLLFEVPDIGLTDPIEVYAYMVDEHENVLLEFGRERDPELFGLSDAEMEEFLRRDIRGGQPGSYALRLEELGVSVGVHGYLSLEFKPVDDTPSFDLHHATIMIRAAFQNTVSLEIALEWEHLALELGDFYLPHAFMDLKAAEWLVLRAGWFEVPVGAFNEYLYPDFLRITGTAPRFARSVVPALWSEVGVQLRGRFVLNKLTNLTYAAFLVNGLEQPDEMPGDDTVQEGGEIRDMRFHARDAFAGDKAFGGRLGLEVGEFDLGVSGYSGRYTVDADRTLSIGDVDASYRGEYLTVRSEAALAWQETSRSVLHKFGMYTLIAARPIPYLEPYVEYDFVDIAGVVHSVLFGIALYPYPLERSTRHLRLKCEAGYDFPQNAKGVFFWFFQLTTGF